MNSSAQIGKLFLDNSLGEILANDSRFQRLSEKLSENEDFQDFCDYLSLVDVFDDSQAGVCRYGL